MLGIGQGLGLTSKLGAQTRLRLDQSASIGLKKRWAKDYYIKTPSVSSSSSSSFPILPTTLCKA